MATGLLHQHAQDMFLFIQISFILPGISVSTAQILQLFPLHIVGELSYMLSLGLKFSD